MSDHDRGGEFNPLTRMLTDGFDALMRQLMFCLPGQIKAFDAEAQRAQVECGIQRLRDGKGETIPVISDVPVLFSGSGEWYFWHEVGPGTEGLIHFSQRAIDTWLDQGGPVAPHESRMLSIDDAFFVPGVRSKPGAIPGFRNDGAGISNYAQDTFVHLKGGGSVDITAPEINLTGNVTITGALSMIGPITSQSGAQGDGAQFSGDIKADEISLKHHTHSQANDSDGDSQVDTDPPQ